MLDKQKKMGKLELLRFVEVIALNGSNTADHSRRNKTPENQRRRINHRKIAHTAASIMGLSNIIAQTRRHNLKNAGKQEILRKSAYREPLTTFKDRQRRLKLNHG